MSVFLFLFIIMPIAEMAVLIKVGGIIGVLNTVGLVLLTAVIGAWLLRQQGLATLLKANQRLNSGELPAKEVAEGLILAVGGALLLTPGFITDTIGFLCLLPGTRHWLAAQALKRMVVSGQSRGFYFRSGGGQGPFDQPPFGNRENPFGRQRPFDRDSNGDIIEGEYQDETESDRDRIEKK
ncbi:FxsA family protein [Marinobacter sp. M216]|uniref:FxsA family protein n=1 Tax=Marinobacter albus TaxID=3030833 RepID=A0ABT7HCM9_9GAMM|nr:MULTISPECIES: FxsA family protein [unclassified Marinobacter]MBW7470419.1 FxsA family protein [Marinobacter sp. F4218]MDK9557316.1 FxsA family protein [Marinobacter sp. M216]